MSKLSKHLPAEQRREATVRAVIALAAKQNPSEITTAAIARHMNLTQGALFRHFADKSAIWESVMRWVAETLLDRTAQAAGQAADPLGALEAVFMAHIEFVASHPGVPRMMLGELQRAEDSAAKKIARNLMRRYGERLAALMTEGKAQGQVAQEIEIGAASALFIGAIQGLVMQSLLAGQPRLIRAQAQGVFSILRRGLAGRYPTCAEAP